MENIKWAKRKYPKTYKKIIPFIDYEKKIKKYKVGRLLEDLNNSEFYKKGTIFLYRKTNPINDYNYPDIYTIFKCIDSKITFSGFHSFLVYPLNFEEITS